MKAFNILLSVYMLVLSSITCSDHDSALRQDIQKEHVVVATHDEHQEEETCSPLCVCSCCGSLAETFAHRETIIYQVFTPFHFVASIQHALSDISFSVWQPPRLA